MLNTQYKIVERVNSGEFMATKAIIKDLQAAYDGILSMNREQLQHEYSDNKLRFHMAKAIADIRASAFIGLV
ncbi:MAG: hypothetical protein ACFFCS_26790 [Candidatus Hodarchaeota archaeon]